MNGDSLFFSIVDRGKADTLLRMAQSIGAKGGTIFLGEGTMQSRFLDWLGINETQKEVLLMAVPESISDKLYDTLKAEFSLHKRYKGIAFSVPYFRWQPDTQTSEAAFDRSTVPPYLCLMTVVDKGKGERCMAVARGAGAQGGTIIHAKGAGRHQDFYFPLTIEPGKDIVLIVAPQATAPAIREAIYAQMGLDKPGAGIIFGIPVLRTIGLYEGRRQEASP